VGEVRGEVRKTVGVYERPEKRGAWRTALLVAGVAIAATVALALVVL
jgi:hypothetical protein